ncbi:MULTISPECIES: ABC transporter substrate-binding protein [unclassified Pseudodesulfovibrio]|uniref:ABC transporter substrate-binding protein n=1 Tax=unclassified Pseudodesulfovibrio TaxID=2661612 RepID=UPI000FEC01F7|nr:MULTISPECIES: ABC transporter substrate-binding protein [unclassified Pseudodesulfovibrio]MCJ2163519.1 ABC transporter substrate-binding protein [Pseudodesulfovibrio sp. S3-i]RWU06755.1 ABC transporter substrate-binding protein [Pseudodesulfovibrio sp. S3]
MKKIRILMITACLSCMALLMAFSVASATPLRAPERIKAVMVGDRLVDVSLKLGIIPEGMSVRLSMWPDKAQGLPLSSQVLGCPNYVTKKNPDTISSFMKERGITRLILEKSNKFCLYMKDVNPVNVADLVKDVPGVVIEYADFTHGVGAGIEEVARLLGKEEQGREVRADYETAMKKVEAQLPKAGYGRRVVILNGNYSVATGKTFIRIEAPGGYTDQYILTPLGCTNVAGEMLTDSMKVSKGHVSASRLAGLAKVNPDIIVATGNGFAVQKALHDAMIRNPALADIPAFRNGDVYSLPFYGDSSILEYPGIFRQWSIALQK